MADNMLTGGGVNSPDTSMYPKFQPVQPVNPLTQIGQLQQLDLQRQQLQNQQFALAKNRLDLVHNEVGSLAAIPGGPSYEDVQDRLTALRNSGAFTGADVANILPHIPSDPGPAGNAARKAVFDKQLQILGSYKEKMDAAYGAPSTANVGDYIVPGAVNPRGGAFTPSGAPLPMGMTPEAKAGRVNYIGPGAQPTSAPQSSLTTREGYALPTPGMPQTGAAASTTMAPQGMAGAPRNASSSPSASNAPSGPAGSLPTGLGPGNERLMADLDAARSIQTDLNPLIQARNNIQALGKNGIGPGTEDRSKIASFLQSAGLGWLPGVNSDRIENMDEALKYTTQAMQGRAAAMRAGTDYQQATTAAGSPNLKMSSTAATNVINSMIGLRRMQQAQTFENAGQGQNPTYLVDSAKWAANQDPRAYSFDLMTDDQKQKVLASLGKEDSPAYKRFVKSLRSAHQTGFMQQ